ncbi:hypothetical protein HW115_06140 [Verrucomicrobiaceae bacterium N1E253]|uniref:Aminoglycoside phosphotransferase domain-containing protein n=1 Tax=Oceaniferula marina TaxID=2748318 RepID=A0A851GE32_9BACT|nr:hypothetical protein [Oceaniferula marina]NWK55182.1 hypothetical protein [Oceaniferula marina]
MHKLLPQLKLNIGENGPLAAWVGDKEKIGFLLGNPEADARRAMVVHTHNSGYVVDKIGAGDQSMTSVIAERKVIVSLPAKLKGIPELRGEQEGDGWATYSTGFVHGYSPGRSDDNRVVDLLSQWMKVSATIPLGETKQWKATASKVSKLDGFDIWPRLSNAALMPIKIGVFHGDFAPWNIKISRVLEISVLDWEHGCSDGPAGWDWLHYMIQRATLVDGMSASEALNVCRVWAETDRGKRFLDAAGWGAQVELWIGTYLVYSSWVAGFDRDELITAWLMK